MEEFKSTVALANYLAGGTGRVLYFIPTIITNRNPPVAYTRNDVPYYDFQILLEIVSVSHNYDLLSARKEVIRYITTKRADTIDSLLLKRSLELFKACITANQLETILTHPTRKNAIEKIYRANDGTLDSETFYSTMRKCTKGSLSYTDFMKKWCEDPKVRPYILDGTIIMHRNELTYKASSNRIKDHLYIGKRDIQFSRANGNSNPNTFDFVQVHCDLVNTGGMLSYRYIHNDYERKKKVAIDNREKIMNYILCEVEFHPKFKKYGIPIKMLSFSDLRLTKSGDLEARLDFPKELREMLEKEERQRG